MDGVVQQPLPQQMIVENPAANHRRTKSMYFPCILIIFYRKLTVFSIIFILVMIERCSSAIKKIRSDQNKVPNMRFLFTNTLIGVQKIDRTRDNQIKSPLNTPLSLNNVEFKLTSMPNRAKNFLSPMKKLPDLTGKIVRLLGMDSELIHSKIRSRQVADTLSNEMSTSSSSRSTTSSAVENSVQQRKLMTRNIGINTNLIKKSNIGLQTDEYHCIDCNERKRRVYVNQGTQVFKSDKSCESGTQTNEEDYREPIVEMISQLTSGQLVALKDFATIMMDTRPQSSMELMQVREKMMTIYFLSQRDADAVRNAQQNRLDEPVVSDRMNFSVDSDRRNREYDDDSIGSGPSSSRHRNFNNFDERQRLMDRRREEEMNERQREFELNEELELRRRVEEIRRRETEEEEHRNLVERQRYYEEEQYRMREQQDQIERYENIMQQQPQVAFGGGIDTAEYRNTDRYNDQDDDRPMGNRNFQSPSGSNKRVARGAFRNNNNRGTPKRLFRGRGRKF